MSSEGHGGGRAGGGKNELALDEESIRQITEGLRGAVAELRSVGTATGAPMGAGFSELALTGMEAGHAGLAGDFEGFCERWEWGVRALVQDASTLAAKVGISAGMLWEEDRYRDGTFKVAVNAAFGNPHASEDEIEGASWDQILAPGMYTPDYSAESFKQAGEDAIQAWKDTGRQLGTEGHTGMLSDFAMDQAGIDEQTRRRALDEAFGPSPEERAHQQGSPDGAGGRGGGDRGDGNGGNG